MQLDELLSSSVSQCNFVLAKIMVNIFTMVSIWPDSYILSVNVVTLLIANFSQPTAGLHHVIISFAALASSRRICLLKFSQCPFWAKHEKKSSIQMHRLYLHAANEFTLNTNRPRQGFGAPLPPVPAKMLNKFKTVQAIATNFETFPKNYLGTFKFVLTCTSKLKNMHFHSKMVKPPASYDVISRNRSNWSSLNLSQTARKG